GFIDDIDQCAGIGLRRSGIDGVTHDVGAACDGLAIALGVIGSAEGIAGPGGQHFAVAGDDLLIYIRCWPATWVRGPDITFLMTPHAHHAGTTAATHVAGGQHQIDDGRLYAVVVVAPDHTLLIGVHGARSVTGILGFI